MSKHVRYACSFIVINLALVSTCFPAPSLDIIKIDLLSLKNWNSTQVSVEGLRLGMGIKLANEVLRIRGLRLIDELTRSGCTPSSHSCYIVGRTKKETMASAVGILVGKSGRITMIDIGIPEDPATLPETIAGRFKGMTRRFFFHYSDELRVNLLGPPDRVKKSPTTDAMQGQIYYYDRLGLIVGTSRSLMRGMKTPTPPELTGIQFVLPK